MDYQRPCYLPYTVIFKGPGSLVTLLSKLLSHAVAVVSLAAPRSLPGAVSEVDCNIFIVLSSGCEAHFVPTVARGGHLVDSGNFAPRLYT